MLYNSTRGNHPAITAAEAIVSGMVPRGGLFVPESLPELNLEIIKNKSYQDLALAILEPFLCADRDYTAAELKTFLQSAYSDKAFNGSNPAPVKTINGGVSVLELWHGPTAAFKDMALQLLPHLLTSGMRKTGRSREAVILVATSGDTGKAALEGFSDVKGTRIMVFYPENGVSPVQERQMLTTTGKNTVVLSVKGNFDDCQTMVKNIFGDQDYNLLLGRSGFELSSANSINWGRLVPQIVYYFWSYFEMVRAKTIQLGDPAVVVVPTGNFGNILAAHYAKAMGLPVSKLVCASNRNKVLTDFIETGVYDRKRPFYKTTSPSMDILISSNLERYLYDLTNRNAVKINRWYEDLNKTGVFKVDDTTRQRMKAQLWAGYADEAQVKAEIARVYQESQYVLDPHTAVGSCVLAQYRAATGDNTHAILASTASPFKFNQPVYEAIAGKEAPFDEMQTAEALSALTGWPVHRALKGVMDMPVLHQGTITPAQGKTAVAEKLGIQKPGKSK